MGGFDSGLPLRLEIPSLFALFRSAVLLIPRSDDSWWRGWLHVERGIHRCQSRGQQLRLLPIGKELVYHLLSEELLQFLLALQSLEVLVMLLLQSPKPTMLEVLVRLQKAQMLQLTELVLR